jgi:hypothetical protein
MGFNEVTAAGQSFSEGSEVFGESFTYTAPNGGATTSGLVGVFNQVEIEYQFADFSVKKLTMLTCVASKPQWGAVVPADRGIITYGGVTYQAEKIDGTNTAAEPAFTLSCKKLT